MPGPGADRAASPGRCAGRPGHRRVMGSRAKHGL